MLVALTLPMLIGLFLVAMELLEARDFGPSAETRPATQPAALLGDTVGEAGPPPRERRQRG